MSLPAYLFTGSRDWNDQYIPTLLMAGLRSWQGEHRERLVIVHGGARGLDTIADRAAKSYDLKVSDYPVTKQEWNHLGRRAGPLRNKRMLDSERVKVVFAFSDELERSRGTANMITQAVDRDIPVYLIQRVQVTDE